MCLLGNSPEPTALRPSGKNRRHHCLSQNAYAILFTQKQLSPFPERLELPFPDGEILQSYREDVSFKRDRFTAWVKADPNDTLERHMVDVRKAFAELREASVRRQEASPQEYFFDSSVPNRSPVQRRLSVYNWNPGPRREKEGAIEKRIAGK